MYNLERIKRIDYNTASGRLVRADFGYIVSNLPMVMPGSMECLNTWFMLQTKGIDMVEKTINGMKVSQCRFSPWGLTTGFGTKIR